jgi:hypothetical protein
MALRAPLRSLACPERIVVDTEYATEWDTGGTEAMVQLALALASLCPNSTYRGFVHSPFGWSKPGGRVLARLAEEYPAIERVPQLHDWASLHGADLVIFPETRHCSRKYAQQGGHWYMWILSSRARRSNWRTLQRGCRLLSHNAHLARDTLAGVTLTRAWQLHPYVTPSLAAHCRASMARRHTLRPDASSVPALPLVLLDSDTPAEIRQRVHTACAGDRRLCDAVHVTNVSRTRVRHLLERASVVVDWCMVGSERMVLEAALCGAVLLTNRCASGSSSEDFPIPPRHVLPSADELAPALRRVLAEERAERRAQAPLRELYTRQHTEQGLRADARRFLRAHMAVGAGKTPYKELYRAEGAWSV